MNETIGRLKGIKTPGHMRHPIHVDKIKSYEGLAYQLRGGWVINELLHHICLKRSEIVKLERMTRQKKKSRRKS